MFPAELVAAEMAQCPEGAADRAHYARGRRTDILADDQLSGILALSSKRVRTPAPPRPDYICEVRYGDATANALQRGLWTHTRRSLKYFDSVTNGWIDYSLSSW